MTLPASGTIAMSQVSTELGRAATATTSLGETAVRNLAGVASGAISMSNLYGKSAVEGPYYDAVAPYSDVNCIYCVRYSINSGNYHYFWNGVALGGDGGQGWLSYGGKTYEPDQIMMDNGTYEVYKIKRY